MTDFTGIMPLPLVTRDSHATEKNWLISGLIGAQETVCFVGPPGVGKSYFAVHMACQIARGQPVFGREVANGSVAYIAAERAEEIFRRVEKQKAIHGEHDLPLHVFDGRGGIDLTSQDAWKRIGASAQGIPSVKAIILDTKRKLIGNSDENSSRDIAHFINSVELLSREFGCSMIVLDHTPKSRSHESAGTNALAGHVDLVVSFKSGQEKVIQCRAALAKNIETGTVGTFKIIGDDVGIVEELSVSNSPSGTIVIRGNDQRILDVITANASSGEINRDELRLLCKREGLYEGDAKGRKAFQRSLEKLAAANRITNGDTVYLANVTCEASL